ncbi:hypothetical protein [Qipengyuania sp. Mu-71]|jgi:hypothetical protein|uniref:hypothetical protein n=1 Tax=Qipengyuania sp. Mu-71 TaxID=3121477 RepID=UPI002FE4CB66
MPVGVLEVIVWTCVGLFVGVVLLGFAALVGWWHPRDEETGKWLKRSVVFPLVGGVVGFATLEFGSGRDTPLPPEPSPTVSPTVSPSPFLPTGTPTPTPRPTPTGTPTPPDPGPLAEACTVSVPQSLTIWADEQLGEPPAFTCAGRQPYPTCLDPLRQRSRPEISSAAARECGDALAAFRREYVAPVYGAKATYQVNLDTAEAALRLRTSDEAVERYDYVTAEISRMNGREWDGFVAIDRQSREDMRACQDERRCLDE